MSTFAELAETIRGLTPAAGETVIVAVDGCGGAGKTTFAPRLARALGGAPLLATDDFASWEEMLEWWPRVLEQVLVPLSEKRPARYQRYDWEANALAEWHSIDSGGVLVMEGVSASRLEFRPYLSYSIWVECPRDVRLARGLARNGPDSLPSWEQWMAAEDVYMAREHPIEHVQLIVNGNPTGAFDADREFEILKG